MRTHVNEEQSKFWNDAAGRGWVELQPILDDLLRPFNGYLMQGVSATSAHDILDVGCGAGGTTLDVARRLRGESHCIGIDISEPLIALAQARAERERIDASFICADAATHPFERGSFDLLISRFGVMFFDDPVQAFSNLRRKLKANGEFRFVAWRDCAENPFMTTAEQAARPFLPTIPDRQPETPGQFAFADQRRISSILEKSGWSYIDIRPIDVDCHFPEKDLIGYFTKLGPLGRVLHEVDDQTCRKIVATVRAAFDSFVFGNEVRFRAACWLASARTKAKSP